MTSEFEGGLWWEQHAGRRRPVALRAVRATAVVQAGHGAVVLRQRFGNDEGRPIEAIYTMPLPSRAALTRLTIEVGGRQLDGQIHPRDEAFAAYDQALTEGHGAALVTQERDEVVTLTVGNVLPGEEVTVEIEYVEPLQVDEGALRWRLPTRVAPRYVPGRPSGQRTGHGASEPTDEVPDADRVSPPEADDAGYRLELSLLVDLGVSVRVESPSHRLRLERVGGEAVWASFAAREAVLDRDVVVLIEVASRGEAVAPALVAHRDGDGEGTFALTLVPDLAGRAASGVRRVMLLLDVSGSMAGASITAAVAAARLCLRHLRRGDEFGVLAFSDRVFRMDGPALRSFDDASLRQADRWLAGLVAQGGTEMFDPLLEAVHHAVDGVVVLLTDGQVANEAIITRAVRSTGSRARIYGFGVGHAVCEGLLRDLARDSGGAVELIAPGESIDEKVVAQFARATAPRVDGLELLTDGVEVEELTPGRLPPLVDGEPWTLLGRYRAPGPGRLLLSGHGGGQPFDLDLALDLPARAERPVLPRLWARERIRDLQALDPGEGPLHEAIAARAVALARDHGLTSAYTSLLAIDLRHGNRRVPGARDPRVVPVHVTPRVAVRPDEGPATMDFMASDPAQLRAFDGWVNDLERERGVGGKAPRKSRSRSGSPAQFTHESSLLQAQNASGLWGEGATGEQLTATVRALVQLARLGVASDHALHGAPVQKAIEAVLAAVGERPVAAEEEVRLVVAALAAAWLVASGRRTRAAVRAAVESCGDTALAGSLDDRTAIEARLDAWMASPGGGGRARPGG